MQMHPLALAALLATVATAQAQTSSGPTTGTPTTTALPEVKVTDEANSAATEGSGQYTAREVSVGKLQQAPRETPQSLSVVTRQQLDDRNLTKVEDAIKLSTGMTVTRFDGTGNITTFQARSTAPARGACSARGRVPPPPRARPRRAGCGSPCG